MQELSYFRTSVRVLRWYFTLSVSSLILAGFVSLNKARYTVVWGLHCLFSERGAGTSMNFSHCAVYVLISHLPCWYSSSVISRARGLLCLFILSPLSAMHKARYAVVGGLHYLSSERDTGTPDGFNVPSLPHSKRSYIITCFKARHGRQKHRFLKHWSILRFWDILLLSYRYK